MIRALTGITAVAVLSSAVYAQSTESRPTFEAADVHVAPQTVNRFMRGGTLHGTRYEIRNASMVDLVSTAYGVDADKVLGGPPWLEMDRFDLFAIAPVRTPPETLNLMLRSLLADRFKLVVKEEPKPMPAYALRVGKQILMKESDGSGEPGCKQTVDTGTSGPRGDGPVAISSLTVLFACKNTSIASLKDQLPIPRKAGEPNRPVVDQTGLKGTWNFDFKFTLDLGNGNGLPIADAIEKQLGLKLTPETLPMPVIEVQSANEKPAPNSPEDLKSFPPLPTEFDVAEIKPFKPSADQTAGGGTVFIARAGRGFGGPGQQLQNGRLNLQGRTLKNLIMQAWDLNSDDLLIGAPKWMDTDRFDVIAKVPSGPITDAFTDLDSIKPLLRTLLMDRFKLAVHTEERPLSGYVLTAPKPKLKPADPANRTRCIDGPGADGKDPRNGNAALGRLVTCQNLTMAQFAELLPNFASGYFRGATVVDKTGLTGAWDLTIYFSPAGFDGGGRGGLRGGMVGGVIGGAASDGGSASDPSGGMSLFDAVNKLLGLKVETQPRTVSVLVIDHVEPKPTDN